MITATHQMSLKQLQDLESLMASCISTDRNTIPIYKHLIDKFHTLPCNILYYDHGKLLGFLRSFFFYSNGCEIALMVDPAYRRQGIARGMLNKLVPLLQIEQIETLYFSTPRGHNQNWLSKLGFNFHGSERQMQYDPSKPVTVIFKPVAINLAVNKDIEALVRLDTICFPKKKPDAAELFRTLLMTPNCSIFVVIKDQQIVGKAHLFRESDRARVTDIGVLPEYRGQGFASMLIKFCINHAMVNNKPRVVLDVEASNENALNLYKRLGFNITNAHDYWRTPMNEPMFGLSSILSDSLNNTSHSQTDSHNKDTP